jgi:hypothetical protein
MVLFFESFPDLWDGIPYSDDLLVEDGDHLESYCEFDCILEIV